MQESDFVFGVFFLNQSVFGFLGNSIMFAMYLSIFISQPQKKKPTDLILTHLTVANTVTLLTRGIPETMAAFGMRDVLNDVGCRSVMYINRVSRGLSICTTCLLSVFQAVTISPSTSRWAQFKPRASNCIVPSFLFFWILNMLLYIRLITCSRAIGNVNISGEVYVSKLCYTLPDGNVIHSVTFLLAITIRDLFFVLLTSWASGYMVIVLSRHRRQVQHIHSTRLSPKSSAEARATKTILLLVTCFACFYWLNTFITLSLVFAVEKDPQLESVSVFLSGCFPALCPLLLISKDLRMCHREAEKLLFSHRSCQ
ncbi:vomeronasal type-1 receptor 3-like [Tachyglossus aculeatus]|uniref:vomeronasal type-1 receptor 3-like n=1 Tax=Tachyglossus aculeatus TaxID=9261 RepID=UPI0018F36922|nr:vomeronasal type-1 receptor 3-like [Tachyglossus aculeatus]